jgi:GTP cyclohydrolase II
METKESILFMKKRKIIDRNDAIAAIEDIQKQINQLKKQKTQLLAIAGVSLSTNDVEMKAKIDSNLKMIHNVDNIILDGKNNNNINNFKKKDNRTISYDIQLTTFVSETILPTKQGKFHIRAYRCETLGMEPLVLMSEDAKSDFTNTPDHVTVRVHDKCMTSEVLGSLKCDCREQLLTSMSYIKNHGGIVIYLQQEGRGIGIANKIAAYSLQEEGADTVEANIKLGLPAEARRYDPVKYILQDLNIKSISLMTNNPYKVNSLKKLGIEVTSRKPIIIKPNIYSSNYLKCKRERMGHYDLISEHIVDVENNTKV